MSERLRIIEKDNNIFIYNTVFGNLYKTDPKTLRFLQSFSKPKLADENKLVKELKRRMFLIEEGKDEYSILKSGHKEFLRYIKTGKLLRKLQLMTTMGCNLNCRYCYENRTCTKTDSFEKSTMKFEVAKKAIDGFMDIVEKNKQPKVFVRYFGGEPLLNWPLIKKASEYIADMNPKTKVVQLINTNGTLMTDEIAAHLGKNKFEVDLSLDAPSAINDKTRTYKSGKGTFKDILRAGELLLKYNVNTEVSATLSDYNINLLKKFIDFVKEKGFDQLEVNTIIYDDTKLCTASIKERIIKLIEAKRYAEKMGVKLKGKWIKLYQRTKNGALNYCGRLGEQFSVTADGEVYPCSGLNIKLGTVDDLKSIFATKEYENIAMRIIGNIPGCLNCEIEGMCVGGCPGSANYLGSSGVYSPELNECEFRKAIIKAQIGDEFIGEDQSYQSMTKNYFS